VTLKFAETSVVKSRSSVLYGANLLLLLLLLLCWISDAHTLTKWLWQQFHCILLVMGRLSRLKPKLWFFRKIEWNWYRNFWSKCNSILILYYPRGTSNWCKRSQNGFYLTSLIAPSADEFISSTPNIWAKNRIDIEFFIKKIES